MPDICQNPLLKGRNKRMRILNQQQSGIIPIPTDGLIAYYPFNGNANDESGYGNNGVVHGALLSTGKDGGANSSYGFNGYGAGTDSNDYIDLGDSSPLVDLPNSDFTISVWIKDLWSSVTNIGNIWCSWKPGTYGLTIQTIGDTGDANYRALRVIIGYTVTSMVYASTRIIPVNAWTHILVTFNSSTKTSNIYINGYEATYATQTPGSGTLKSDSGTKKIIGKLAVTNNLQTFNGYIDTIRLYNRILTTEEIMALYHE
jgi:hypothetical protein